MKEISKDYRTEQERFWASQFGDHYSDRNQGEAIVATDTALFAKILSCTKSVDSLIEFGANTGLNLIAIRRLRPDMELSAIEINTRAVSLLELIKGIKVYAISILDFEPDTLRDLVFTKGVLIHMNPDMLPRVYDKLYQTSRRYICLAEYYNPTPVEVTYHGHHGYLFKRDFAGEMLDRFDDLQLVNYGFTYHRDPHFPQDDLTWFLLEKTG